MTKPVNDTALIYEETKRRAPTQRERLLEILREAGDKGVLNTDLVEVCIGYRSRIAELYQMGYKIDVEYLEQGVCIYTLRKEPVVPITEIPTAISMVSKTIDEEYSGAITSETLVAILKELNFNVVRRSGSHKFA